MDATLSCEWQPHCCCIYSTYSTYTTYHTIPYHIYKISNPSFIQRDSNPTYLFIPLTFTGEFPFGELGRPLGGVEKPGFESACCGAKLLKVRSPKTSPSLPKPLAPWLALSTLVQAAQCSAAKTAQFHM